MSVSVHSLRSFILGVLFIIPAMAFAEEFPEEVRSDLRVLADEIDRLFGNKREDDFKSDSTIRLSFHEKLENRKEPEHIFGFKFNIKLAAIQRWEDDLNRWAKSEAHKLEHRDELYKKPSEHNSAGPKD